MDNTVRVRRLRALAGMAGLGLALAAGTVLAGTGATSFGVSLRVTGACEVDSGPVVAGGAGTALRRPEVRCARPLPQAISVTREPYSQALPAAVTATELGDVQVVTLTF